MPGESIGTFDELLKSASVLPMKRIAVVYPKNAEIYEAIREASKLLKIHFQLFCDLNGGAHKLEGLKLDGVDLEIVPSSGPDDAVSKSLEFVTRNQTDILMKGDIDTGTLMKAVLQDSSGMKTGRLLTDIFVLDFPARAGNRFIMITDGGMTLSPDLKNKIELIANAVEVAHALGNRIPKVAVLSATEFVLPNLQSTIDAAALSKMNERGQIKGCIVDGPLALDNAISPEAASEKNIDSPVAGKADILVAANIESANSLAKSTTFFANLRLAHVIVGANIPILIPSRSDKSDAKVLSIALGAVMSEYNATSGQGRL